MIEKRKICPKCNSQMFQRFNSTMWYCPTCENSKKFIKVDELHTSKKTGAKKGLKSKKTKFNFYSTTAWKNCSHYILTYYADNEGNVQCSTSSKWMKVTDKNCHCGHYIKTRDMSKTNYAVAFEFTNLAPQSYQENIFRSGNQLVMREWLIKQHGLKAIEELELKQHNICKLDTIVLLYWAKFYEKQLDILFKKRGIKDHWKSK
jgi:uncharacterized Zn finger protein (UPF0148 family)